MATSKIVGIRPLHYVHILDMNTNITSVEVGPQTMVLQENHKLVLGPAPFIVIPPGHYCRIFDPVDRSKYVKGQPCVVRFKESEMYFHGEPFPLYPGETLSNAASPTDYKGAIKPLPVIKANEALLLEALVDHTGPDGVERKAGQKWHVTGPKTFLPRPEIAINRTDTAVVLKPGQALHLRATQALTDRDDVSRVTGEEWLVRKIGAYLPDVYVETVEILDPYILTENIGLYMLAKETGRDSLGKMRKAGDEWLVTCDDAESYIPEVIENVVKVEKRIVLSKQEFAVIDNPLGEDGRPQLGQQELRVGCCSFFLQPGEVLVKKDKAFILGEDEAVVLRAVNAFEDTIEGETVQREPGDTWMIVGPCDYIPPIEVTVIEKRKAVPLSKNEGIYVRDIQSGKVRAVMGPQAYLLQANEEKWKKVLPSDVELMLKSGGGMGDESIRKTAYFESSIDPVLLAGPRDMSRVVTYRCPHNTAVQVYNYQHKTARVVFGPDMVVLGPHEDFNVLSLSAGKPKKEDALRSLALMLGPDFTTDIIEVETSDHARLQVKLAFNCHFEYTKGDQESEAKIFSVPDFIGFACRQVSSRIRGAVAQIPFDEFHRFSQKVIRSAVLGMDEDKKIRKRLVFEANNLVITNVDIQSIEPIDARMRDSLMKSVQMAIEIATRSIELAAEHDAKRVEQEAQGHLERQALLNEKLAEEARKTLFELQAASAAVESTGQAKAEAQAQAERLLIEGESEIEAARLRAQAAEIEHSAELNARIQAQDAEIAFHKEMNELEITKAQKEMAIEVEKFSAMVSAVGANTIRAISTAGPRQKVRLLKGLGLESTLLTSGQNPINMFNFANRLVNPAISHQVSKTGD